MASQSAEQKEKSRQKHAHGMLKWLHTQRKGVEEVENGGRQISAEGIRVLALARAAKGGHLHRRLCVSLWWFSGQFGILTKRKKDA